MERSTETLPAFLDDPLFSDNTRAWLLKLWSLRYIPPDNVSRHGNDSI